MFNFLFVSAAFSLSWTSFDFPTTNELSAVITFGIGFSARITTCASLSGGSSIGRTVKIDATSVLETLKFHSYVRRREFLAAAHSAFC